MVKLDFTSSQIALFGHMLKKKINTFVSMVQWSTLLVHIWFTPSEEPKYSV